MSETDKRYKFTNGPESNSKPTYVVEVGLKSNFWGSSHSFL